MNRPPLALSLPIIIAMGWLVCTKLDAGNEPQLLAQVILVNGKIWTGDRERPEIEALAVWQGRILAAGTNAQARALAGPATTVIDLHGRRAVPGFYDAHLHLLGSGLRLNQVSLKDAKNEQEFGERLVQFDRKLPRDGWLIGGDWDHDRAFAGKLPTSAILDRYVPNRPVFLRRYDGHMALANSMALKTASITAQTPDPSGGVIYRDPRTKEPTGILRDNAMDLVSRLVPPPSEADVAMGVKAALAEIARNGLTTVEDMDGSDQATRKKLLRHYQELARTGQLTARINLRWPLADWEQLARIGIESGWGNDWVQLGGVKGFMDGSLGSSTAKMFSPYINEPTSTGVFVTQPEQMRQLVAAADRAGLSVAVHAIGDRANAQILDIYADVARENGHRDRRFRVEHAQHLRAQDYARFEQLGVIASMQPYHVIDDGRWAESRIGPERCATSYAYRALLDARAHLAFGSDWSVAPLSPLLGIDAAVHRRPLDGRHPGGWFPEQRISIQEALEAYTQGAAFASFQEKDRGSLEVGKLADVTVLSRDILNPAESEHIAETAVGITIVGGRIVYQTANGS
jgi:predicted amidohydrolase YtcJ